MAQSIQLRVTQMTVAGREAMQSAVV